MGFTKNFLSVAPDPQVSTNTHTVVDGSEIDARHWKSLSYTIKVATNDVDWEVFGANADDYSDEVSVLTKDTVAAGAVGAYSVTQAPFGFYRVKIDSAVDDTHGTATVVGYAKG